MAYISKITLPNGTSYDIKDSSAQTQLATKAPLESPTLTGAPKAPTATTGTNNTQIATTAFVKTAIDNGVTISNNLTSGTAIGTITVNGVDTTLYSPGTPTTITVQTGGSPVIEFITSTNTAASNALTGVTTSYLTADGMTIIYKTAYPLSEENTTLELFDLSNNSLGVYPIYLNDTTQCKMPFKAGTVLLLSYYSNKWYLINPFAAVL